MTKNRVEIYSEQEVGCKDKTSRIEVYAGLEKMSCDMCGNLVRPEYTVKHKDGSKADICSICYGRCLAYPKFQQGLEQGTITVEGR